MITKLVVQNFKSWGNTGKIRLAPITGFFGSNSSGKTSLLQLLLMLKQTTESADRAQVLNLGDDRSLGFEPTDREEEKLGYDVESSVPGTGKLRFIEVKGRITGASTITVTRNEILYSLNKPDDFILAIVEFLGGDAHRVHYIRQPFQREPDFGVTSVNYDFAELLERAGEPS